MSKAYREGLANFSCCACNENAFAIAYSGGHSRNMRSERFAVSHFLGDLEGTEAYSSKRGTELSLITLTLISEDGKRTYRDLE